jgi:hypothetical protein
MKLTNIEELIEKYDLGETSLQDRNWLTISVRTRC